MLLLAMAVGCVASHAPAALPLLGLAVAGMIVDAQCVLCDAQALTVDACSTNTYDTGAAGNSLEVGEPMCIACVVDVAADHTTGDETYEFQVIQSANADLSSPDILSKTDSTFLDYAKLTAGARFYLPIPPGMKTKRYIGLYFNGGGTTPTITLTAFIQPLSMIQNDKTYASGLHEQQLTRLSLSTIVAGSVRRRWESAGPVASPAPTSTRRSPWQTALENRRTMSENAREAARTIAKEQQQRPGKKVTVVAVEAGHDGFKVREEGERFTAWWFKNPKFIEDEKKRPTSYDPATPEFLKPSWQEEVAAFERKQRKAVAAADAADDVLEQ
jgi:hypothetical protein